jgi:prepilin signal peptidase PulO-like enzyme (type II secretory pathway)
MVLIAIRRREWASRVAFVPYLALAAMIWVFLPEHLHEAWLANLRLFTILVGGSPPPPTAQ